MKKYLLWKTAEEQLQSPLLAAQAPDEPHPTAFLQLPTVSVHCAPTGALGQSPSVAVCSPIRQYLCSDSAVYPCRPLAHTLRNVWLV